MSRLSDSQLIVLTAACQREDRCVFPVTAKLKGNAAGNVLKSLLKKDLIKEVRAKRDDTVWRHDEERGRMTLVATTAAFAAIGIGPSDEAEDAEADATEEAPANVEAKPNARPKLPKTKEPKTPRPRDGTKQAQLIAMLRRAKGAPSTKSSKRWSGSLIRCAEPSPARSRRNSGSTSPRRRTTSAVASIELQTLAE